MTKKFEKDITKGSESIRKKHFKYLESCFNDVRDENELRNKHEENLKSIIDNQIANNPIGDEDKEETIKNLVKGFDEDFRLVLVLL